MDNFVDRVMNAIDLIDDYPIIDDREYEEFVSTKGNTRNDDSIDAVPDFNFKTARYLAGQAALDYLGNGN